MPRPDPRDAAGPAAGPGLSSAIAPQLISAKATAEALSISLRLLYSLTQSGEMPAVRIGRIVRYRVSDVEAFIARHQTRSRAG